MGKRHDIPDAQVAAFLANYRWLLAGKPREKLAYRIIERQREEIARLRYELDVLKGGGEKPGKWAELVESGR